MNFSATDSVIGRQRCRQWTPLITQQLRLRHLYRISAFNLKKQGEGGFYFTLHLTHMSAPFYTSEVTDNLNPKWAELDIKNLPHLSTTTLVIRVWQQKLNELDIIIVTWGVNLSGLVYLGNKRSDIQPVSFMENSVIFHLRGGYFTSHNTIKTDTQKPLPFIDNLNVLSDEENTKVYRNSLIKIQLAEIRRSYNVQKLQKLHALQVLNKNKSFDSQILRDKIKAKCGLCSASNIESSLSQVNAPAVSTQSNIRYAPQLLTMNSLNKMLQDKPTKLQRQEIVKTTKEIEISKFKTRLLTQERDKKTAYLRLLKQKHANLCDDNEERHSQLMDDYHKLSKESEKLREWKKSLLQHREIHFNTSLQLQHRRRQLMQQLLFIFPIHQVSDNKFFINNIHLPNSDILTDCNDGNLSVALGYVTHILTMCSSFLQVPLRYPVAHVGSRSCIRDQISSTLSNRDRDFPLYTKGKDRITFDYAVYLLNKNIAQLRWFCGLNTPELKATLANLFSLLKGKEQRNAAVALNSVKQEEYLKVSNGIESNALPPLHRYGSCTNICDPILDSLRHDCQIERAISPPHRPARKSNVKNNQSESGPGLSEILAIPEAFLNRQISSSAFKSYMSTHNTIKNANKCVGESTSNFEVEKSCDIQSKSTCNIESIEQGTDMLDPNLNITNIESKTLEIKSDSSILRQNVAKKVDKSIKQKKRVSRSVGSYTDDENHMEVKPGFEMGSDPFLNVSVKTVDKETEGSVELPSSMESGQQEFLQKWLDSGPALVCSEENLYPDEILGSTSTNSNPLTTRTDALLHTTSFNLVKPKL